MTRELPNVGDIIYSTFQPGRRYKVTEVLPDNIHSGIRLLDLEDDEVDSLRLEVWTNKNSSWLVQVPEQKKQVGGDHYAKHSIQPWDIIDAYGLDFYEGNAVKYLLRYKDKNGVEDLKKAIHYIEKIIEREQNA